MFSVYVVYPLLTKYASSSVVPSSRVPLSSRAIPIELGFDARTFGAPFRNSAHSKKRDAILSISGRSVSVRLIGAPIAESTITTVSGRGTICGCAMLRFTKVARATALLNGTACPYGSKMVAATSMRLRTAAAKPNKAIIGRQFIIVTGISKASFGALRRGASACSSLRGVRVSRTKGRSFPLRGIAMGKIGGSTVVVSNSISTAVGANRTGRLSVTLGQAMTGIAFGIGASGPTFDGLGG